MKRSYHETGASSSKPGPYYCFKPQPSCYSKEKYTYTRKGYKPPKSSYASTSDELYKQEGYGNVPEQAFDESSAVPQVQEVIEPPEEESPKTMTPTSLDAFRRTKNLIDQIDDIEVLKKMLRIVKGIHRAIPSSINASVNPDDKKSFYSALHQVRISLDNHVTSTLRRTVLKHGFGALTSDFKPDTSEVVFDIEHDVEMRESSSISR